MKASGWVISAASLLLTVSVIVLFFLAAWLRVPFTTEEVVEFRGAWHGPAISLYVTCFVFIGVAVVAIVAALAGRLVKSLN